MPVSSTGGIGSADDGEDGRADAAGGGVGPAPDGPRGVPAAPGRPVRVAIVGTGGIAGIHAQSLAALGGRAEIVAAADVDHARLDAFCDRWQVPGRFTGLDALLAGSPPDLVHLCTPPGLHKEQALACLAAGVPVLCEKPPTLSLADLDEIGAAERAGGAFFATVFQHRFGSGAARLRAAMATGALGRPLVAVCHTLWYRPDAYFAVPWRGRWETEGGGPTMGHGIHQFDLLLAVLGEWREITAVAARLARPTAAEDVSCAIATFDGGAVATVVNSLLSPRETSYLRFDFEHATVELEHLYGYGDADWRVHPAPGHEDAVAAAWEAGPSGRPSGHSAQFAAVLDAVAAGAAPPVTLAEARRTLEFVAATYASAFEGRPVARGTIGPADPYHRRMQGPGAPWPAEAAAPAGPAAPPEAAAPAGPAAPPEAAAPAEAAASAVPAVSASPEEPSR
ncbi:Gfo/Idh/MocA family protein [Streptomyces sp. NPDC021224]|uniref:Gfo/Idh/MocA family protein n=1 Tax=unclassified Streptomyces TaxID=2593676 RepID=UPI00379C65C3